MSRVIENFDPSDWRECLPGVFCRKDDPQEIAFLCDPEPEPKPEPVKKQKGFLEALPVAKKVEKAEEAKTESL